MISSAVFQCLMAEVTFKYFERCQWYFVKIVKTFSWSSCWISSRRVRYIDSFWISFSGLCSTWAIVVPLMKSISFFNFSFSSSSFFNWRKSKICVFILSLVWFPSTDLAKMFKSSSKHPAYIILKNFMYNLREMCSAGSTT